MRKVRNVEFGLFEMMNRNSYLNMNLNWGSGFIRLFGWSLVRSRIREDGGL